MMNLDQLPHQRPNEQVVLFLRRNWVSVFSILAAFALLIFLPIALGWFFWDRVSLWLTYPFLGPIIVALGSMYALSVWLLTFIEFTDYYLDTWIITNERIINIEQHGLFNRTASELDLASVQDATAEIRGMLRTVFSFGDVVVQTAGEKGRFHFKSIDNPEEVKELVTRLVDEDKKRLTSSGRVLMGKVKTVGR